MFLISACSHTDDLKKQPLKPINPFIKQGSAPLDMRWWLSFEDKNLNELIQNALKDNLSLKASNLRLKSKALDSNIAASALYPSLNLNASTTVKSDDLNRASVASLGLSASWELDFFGRISANEQKAYWQYQGQQALFRTDANLVAGNVSNAWFSLISQKKKNKVLNTQFERTKASLKVISRRFAMGKNSITDIWQQQKLLKSIEVLQAKNVANIYSQQQKLALLLGVNTHELANLADKNLPNLPALPDMGLPAKTLLHRPDIQYIITKIEAADAQLAIAISEQYPRITLRANYASSKNNTHDLLQNWSGNLITSFIMPLFDSGARKHNVSQKKLLLQSLIVDYQEVWLKAVANVNQILVNETQLLKVVENLTLQTTLAKQTQALINIKYLNGKSSYLNLLKAQESILVLERQMIDAQKNVMNNRVLLYRALSHGDFNRDQTTKSKSINTGIKS